MKSCLYVTKLNSTSYRGCLEIHNSEVRSWINKFLRKPRVILLFLFIVTLFKCYQFENYYENNLVLKMKKEFLKCRCRRFRLTSQR